MGDVAPFVVPLAVTLFLFILIANWLALIPSRGYLESPSADINMTLALGAAGRHLGARRAHQAEGLAALLRALRPAVPRHGAR